jgi:hypothetical protein
LFDSPSVEVILSRRMRWAERVSRIEVRNAYRIFVWNLRARDHLEDLVVDGKGLDLGDVVWESVDWIILAQDKDQWGAVETTVMNHRVPEKSGKFLTGSVTASLSRRIVLRGVR